MFTPREKKVGPGMARGGGVTKPTWRIYVAAEGKEGGAGGAAVGVYVEGASGRCNKYQSFFVGFYKDLTGENESPETA